MIQNPARFLFGNILVFALTDMLGNFARRAVFPYASLYILALGGSPEQIGFINLLALLAGLVMMPVAGHITDRANRVHLIAMAGFISSLLMGLIVFAPTWQVVA